MDMTMNPNFPGWLTPVAWVFLALAVGSSVAIAYDIYGRRRRHTSLAAELVWVAARLVPGTAGAGALRPSRRTPDDSGTTAGRQSLGHPSRPAAVAGLPGGAASAVAHVIGVPLVIASGLTIAGINLWVMILVIGVIAMALLFGYERTARSGQRAGTISVGTALTAAILTVLAFDIGMGGWMLLLHFNEFMPPATEVSFWFLMQIGIVLGLITGYPAATWLARTNQSTVPA